MATEEKEKTLSADDNGAILLEDNDGLLEFIGKKDDVYGINGFYLGENYSFVIGALDDFTTSDNDNVTSNDLIFIEWILGEQYMEQNEIHVTDFSNEEENKTIVKEGNKIKLITDFVAVGEDGELTVIFEKLDNDKVKVDFSISGISDVEGNYLDCSKQNHDFCSYYNYLEGTYTRLK